MWWTGNAKSAISLGITPATNGKFFIRTYLMSSIKVPFDNILDEVEKSPKRQWIFLASQACYSNEPQKILTKVINFEINFHIFLSPPASNFCHGFRKLPNLHLLCTGIRLKRHWFCCLRLLFDSTFCQKNFAKLPLKQFSSLRFPQTISLFSFTKVSFLIVVVCSGKISSLWNRGRREIQKSAIFSDIFRYSDTCLLNITCFISSNIVSLKKILLEEEDWQI